MQELDPWDLTSCNHLTASERKSPQKLKPDIGFEREDEKIANDFIKW